jgi:hypothetical protein
MKSNGKSWQIKNDGIKMHFGHRNATAREKITGLKRLVLLKKAEA